MSIAKEKAIEILHSMEKAGKKTQNELILSHMIDIGPITPMDALEQYGCMRLGARILNLRELGVPIETHIVYKGNKHWASYSLEEAS